jgi:hypothetical protein
VLARDGVPEAGRSVRILSLGAAAGTFTRLFGAVFPGCTVDGVELDPTVVELGARHFGPRGAPGADVAGLDARVFVACTDRQYDVILVDAYARQIYIPAHVASREFFAAVRARLVDGGVVSVNVGGLGFDDPVLTALGGTLAAVFGEAQAFRVPFSRNFVLLARAGRPLDRSVLARAAPADPELAAVLGRMADDAHWRRFTTGGPVLDDDRPVLDALQHASLAADGGDPALVVARGDADPDAAGEAARAHLLAGRAEACLATVASARVITPYLRVLAGDARWALHDPAGADAELRAAEAAGVAQELRGYLEGRLRIVGDFLAGIEAGRAAARRNGWLAALCAAGLAALGVVLRRCGG